MALQLQPPLIMESLGRILGDVVAGTATERDAGRFRAWMRRLLDDAAGRLGVRVTGVPVFGFRLRSAGAPAQHVEGARWLRVVVEQPRWLPDEYWTGNVDANVIGGVAKPVVLDAAEWDAPDLPLRVRAEAMSVLPGRPCSPTEVLRVAPELSDGWWAELRNNLEAVGRVPTGRFADRGRASRHIRRVFGDELADRLRPTEFATAHADLHWSNVLARPFGLVDWEMWGLGPVGMDAASLYLYALLVPEVAERVWATFEDVLDTPTGRIVRVHVAAALIGRADEGSDMAEVSAAAREHIGPLLDRVSAGR